MEDKDGRYADVKGAICNNSFVALGEQHPKEAEATQEFRPLQTQLQELERKLKSAEDGLGIALRHDMESDAAAQELEKQMAGMEGSTKDALKSVSELSNIFNDAENLHGLSQSMVDHLLAELRKANEGIGTMVELEKQLQGLYKERSVSDCSMEEYALKLEEADKALTKLKLKLEELETDAANKEKAKAITEEKDTDELLREAQEHIKLIEAGIFKVKEEEVARLEVLACRLGQENADRLFEDLKESEGKARQLEDKVKGLEETVKELTELVQVEVDEKEELLQSLSRATHRAANAEEKLKELSDVYQIEKDAAVKNEHKLEQHVTKIQELEAGFAEIEKTLESYQIELRNSSQKAADHESKANFHKNEAQYLLEKTRELEALIETARLKEHAFEESVRSLHTELDESKHKAMSAENTETTLKEAQAHIAELEQDLQQAYESGKNLQIETKEKLELQKTYVAELEKDLEDTRKSLEELQFELKDIIQRASDNEVLHKKEADLVLEKCKEFETSVETLKLREHHKEELIKSLEVEVEDLKVQAVLAANLEQALNDSKNHVVVLEQNLEIAETKAAELAQKLSTSESKVSTHESILGMHEKGADELRNKIANLEEALAVSETIIQHKDASLHCFEVDTKEAKAAVLQYEEHLKDLLVRSEELQKNLKIRTDEAESKYQELEELLSQSSIEVGELEESNAYFQAKEKEADEKLAEFKQMLQASREKEAYLQENLKSMEESASQLGRETEEHLVKLEQKLSAAKMNAAELEMKAAELEQKLHAAEGRASEHENDAKEYSNKMANLEEAVTGFEETLLHKEDSIRSLLAELKEAKAIITKHEESLNECEFKFKELQHNLQSRVDIAESKSQSLEHLLIQSSTRAEELEASIFQFQAKAKDTDAIIADLEQHIRSSKGREASMQEKLEILEQTVSKHQEEKVNLSRRILELDELLALEHAKAENSIKGNEEILRHLETALQKGDELEEKLKAAEDRCMHHETTGKELAQRYVELENGVAAFEMTVKELKDKVFELEKSLESAYLEKQELREKEACLQEKLKTMEEIALHHDGKAKASSERALQLEELLISERSLTNHTSTKTEELQKELESMVQRTDELQEKLKSAEKNCKYHEQTAKWWIDKSSGFELDINASHKLIKNLSNTVEELEQSLSESSHKQEELMEKLKASKELCTQHENHVQNLNVDYAELVELYRASLLKSSEFERLLENSKIKHLHLESVLYDMNQNSEFHESNAKELTEKIHELEQLVTLAKGEAKEYLEKVVSSGQLFSDLQEVHRVAEAEANNLKEQLLFFQEQVKEMYTVKDKNTIIENEYNMVLNANSKLQDESTHIQVRIADMQNQLQDIEQERKGLATQLETANESLSELEINFEKEKLQLFSQEEVQVLQKTIESLAHKLKLEEEGKLRLQEFNEGLRRTDAKKTEVIEELKIEIQKLKESENKSSPATTMTRELDQEYLSSIGKLRKRKGKSKDSFNAAEVEKHKVMPKVDQLATSGKTYTLGMLAVISTAAYLFGFWTNCKLYR